jgi:hypothetical protein
MTLPDSVNRVPARGLCDSVRCYSVRLELGGRARVVRHGGKVLIDECGPEYGE